MPDLFDWKPAREYPETPGFKERTTSREAARKIAPRAQTLRDQVLITLRVAWPGGLTADEVARKIGKREFSVRPRLSELRTAGEIMPAMLAPAGRPLRRPNESGVDAIVWVCRAPTPRATG